MMPKTVEKALKQPELTMGSMFGRERYVSGQGIIVFRFTKHPSPVDVDNAKLLVMPRLMEWYDPPLDEVVGFCCQTFEGYNSFMNIT
ncbi:hypothetical protein L218DRAFT_964889 [Marasmius fiardii PR-910]|nr:hypothetical protein L218DRAFT_964889 [Marasmius fiardii PR-910]